MDYNFNQLENFWQQEWKKHEVYKISNDSDKPPYYVLDMFPYPSGAGLHVGHPLGYIASDIFSRFKRLKGFNVLHPMGFDSFGLPAEQYALETGQHPATTTEVNIATFKSQLDKIGFSYDWSREVRTSDPAYYKWTQWIFLQLFNSYFCNTEKKARPIEILEKKYAERGSMPSVGTPIAGKHFTAEQWKNFSYKEQQDILMSRRLAYSSFGEVNWCEALGTVLANDEVINGLSERGGHPVVKKKMRQWFLRITSYADRLLESLNTLDFSTSMKEMQRNWIGKSEGAEIKFKLEHSQEIINVYTTRPDTMFGVDFLVLAPELELVQKITTSEQRERIDAYLDYVKSRSDRERMSEVKQITGCFTGANAINPFSGKLVPVWIAEYVLSGYGTGAIMAVPCGDQRDFLFARHFDIPITNIIGEHFNETEANPTKEAVLHNSGFLDGHIMKDAIGIALQKIEQDNIGRRKVNFRMRDAGFSRQRYWGEPFPIVWVDGVAVPLDEDDLPVELPFVETYGPGPEGEGPLANLKEWTSTPTPPSTPTLLHRVEKGAEPSTFTSNPSFEEGLIETPESYSPKGAQLVPKYHVGTPVQFEFAKQMRREYTEAENILWQELRTNKLDAKFRRQHPIDNYVVDFVALQSRLIIEVDGEYHETSEQIEYDKERTKILSEIGFNVIRFNNSEILNNLGTVLGRIANEVTNATAVNDIDKHKAGSESSHPSPPVESGRGVRETSTMPGYAGSSWYFLRYMDPKNENTFCDRKASDYWGQVDVYIGGTEHAVGHLLYSRMWTKVLYDLDLIGFDEPFKRLVNQGMITGKSYFFNVTLIDGEQVITSYKKDVNEECIRFKYGHQFVDVNGRLTKSKFEESNAGITFKINWETDEDGAYIFLKEESEKMSKSKFNVDNPDDIVKQYGADTFRMYEMFLGPVEQSKPWDTKGIEGVHRFLRKLWRLFNDDVKGKVWTNEPATRAELKILHKTIKKIESDTDQFSFNTAVSAFMVAVNELAEIKCYKKDILQPLLILLAPYAPHIAEELWHQIGNKETILDAAFPVLDETYLVETSKEYPVSINGKLRTTITLALDAAREDVEKATIANEIVQKWLEGKPPIKIIFVPAKMINVVV